MWRSLLTAVLLSTTTSIASAGDSKDTTIGCNFTYDPLDHWEFAFETGALWSFGSNATPLDYVLLPQLLTFKSPYVFKGEFLGGTLALRNRLTIAVEPIVEGPENYFIGFTGAGLLEWWNPARNFSLFFTAGGGLGLMDSKGYEVEGGQGQDLNYTWLVYSGVRIMPAERVSLSLGLHFQHISNMDQDDVNPGIDAIGPMFSVGWHF